MVSFTGFCTLTFRTYSLQNGKEAEYHQFHKLYRQTLEVVQAEADAENLYHSVLLHFTNKISFDRSLIPEVEIKVFKLKELKDKYKTYQLHYQHFYISLVYYQINGDYKKAMAVCDEYEAYLAQHKRFLSRIRYANFLLLKMDAALQLQDAGIVKDCFEKALPLFPVAHANWFMLHEVYFALLLKKGQYLDAADIMKNVLANKKLSDLPMRNQEIWTIYQAYLWLGLTYKGNLALRAAIFPDKRFFSLGRFLNSIPAYKKDKQGYNISVLILQMLILLQEKRFQDCIKRAEALKQYIFKHLKHDETYRNQLFMRMIIRATEVKFDTQLIHDTFILRWLKKLQQQKFDPTPTQNRIEVLPYEELWEMVIEITKKKDEIINEKM